jgi:hypothetical protein
MQAHRERARRTGLRRVELQAREDDAETLRTIAKILAAGGPDSQLVRTYLLRAIGQSPPDDLPGFLANSPLVGVELELERDRSTSGAIDLG